MAERDGVIGGSGGEDLAEGETERCEVEKVASASERCLDALTSTTISVAATTTKV